MGKGFNTFRVAFMMERLIPTRMTGTVNTTYSQGLQEVRFLASLPRKEES